MTLFKPTQSRLSARPQRMKDSPAAGKHFYLNVSPLSVLLDHPKEIDIRAIRLSLSLLFRLFPSHIPDALAPLSSAILGEILFSPCLGASHPSILLAFYITKAPRTCSGNTGAWGRRGRAVRAC